MTQANPSRRTVPAFPWILALPLCLALGCKKDSVPAGAAGTPPPAAEAKPFVVGFVYVGPKDDWGYNQAHAEGAAALAKMPGVQVREEENVPETVAVQKTMESMVSLDGASRLAALS